MISSANEISHIYLVHHTDHPGTLRPWRLHTHKAGQGSPVDLEVHLGVLEHELHSPGQALEGALLGLHKNLQLGRETTVGDQK